MSDIILKVSNKSYRNWESVYVGKSLMQLAGSFGFSTANIHGNIVSDVGLSQTSYKPEHWAIRQGNPCTVEIDGQVLITGYVEEMPMSYDKEAHTIQVSGRDRTGDLVDCSYIETPNKWKRQSIENIVKTLCDPFDIEVVVDTSVISEAAVEINDFAVEQGASILDDISRVCMHKAILPVCYGDGKLTLTRAGTNKTKDNLELGVNILSAVYEQSDLERFSKYVVKGQGVATSFFDFGADMDSRHGEALDDVIDRYRPLIIIADGDVTDKDCEKRAAWESRVRAGQSRKIEYTVQGWTQSNGIAWPLNSLVTVRDKFFGIDGPRLISGLEFSIDPMSGTTTRISVVPKDTFSLREVPITAEDTESLIERMIRESQQ